MIDHEVEIQDARAAADTRSTRPSHSARSPREVFRGLALIAGLLAVGCQTEKGPSQQDGSATESPDTGSSTSDTSPTSDTGTSTSGTGSSSTTEDEVSPTTTGPGPDPAQCDPWAQDCPEGLKCMAFAEEDDPAFTGNKCTPVAQNPGTAGEPCKVEGGWWSGIDDCDYGHACWNIDHETNTGVCLALCVGNSDSYSCPNAGEVCVFWSPGLAHVCLNTCNPLLQDCEGADQLCVPNYASDAREFVCQRDYGFDEGQEFDPCQFSNVCDPGLLCLDSARATECDQGVSACCLAMCDLTDPHCNGAGAVCESFYDEGDAPPEYANVGICTLPG